MTQKLSGPISRDIAILSLRYPISRDTFSGRLALPQIGAIPPPVYLVSHRHICAIPHFETYRVIIVRKSPPPPKTNTKQFRDTIAANIARYEEYRYWASKPKRCLERPFGEYDPLGMRPIRTATAFSSFLKRSFSMKAADFRRKPQQTAGTCRKPQIGFRPLRLCVSVLVRLQKPRKN